MRPIRHASADVRPRVACRRLRVACVVPLAVAAHAVASPAQAQLQYDRTTFVHGINDGPGRFRTPDTPGILARDVNLGPRFDSGWNLVDLSSGSTIANQALELRRDWIAPTGGQHVLTGLSMGGLVARRTYLDSSSNIAGIVTIGSPHQGAIIADNATKVTAYGARLVSDFVTSVINIILRPQAVGMLGLAISTLLNHLANHVINDKLKPWVENLFGINSAALLDLKTASPSIADLKARADTAPHANVIGTIGKRNAPFRLAYSALYKDGDFDRDMRRKNAIKSAAKTCAHMGYNWIVKTAWGKACHKIDRTIGSLDGRWVTWTLNGNANLPFDGLLPNSYQQYPGGAQNFQADGANHMNLQYHPAGISATARAMLQGIRMRPAGVAISP